MPLQGEATHRPTYTGHRPLPGVRGVWIAKHEILGENCIQKTYEPTGREDAVAFAEPRLLNELDHKHITPLREAQFDPDRPGHVTLVMRVYEGGSVKAAMEAGHRFSAGDVIGIIGDIADALAYLHVKKGIVHRDVKPGNGLLDGDRRTGYLSDFGSAARVDSGLGTSAAIRSTALYQAPEVARTGRYGPPADIYALGLTAFEMLNGLFPYGALDAAEIDRRVNSGRRALPDRMLAPAVFVPCIPARLVRLVRRMIDIDPSKRPGTAAEALGDLRSLKCVDWYHAGGEGLDGEWSGRWPPRRRQEEQIELKVASTILRGGASRGSRRLAADYRSATSGGWRTVGLGPVTIDAQDAAAVSAFFNAVDAAVAKRWPA